MAELDEDALRLHADEIDLVDVGHPQQPLTDVFGQPLEISKALAIGGNHVERRIDVAEFVVEVRADDVGRQIAADVADLLAYLVPELLDPTRRRGVGERDLDESVSGLRIAGDPV